MRFIPYCCIMSLGVYLFCFTRYSFFIRGFLTKTHIFFHFCLDWLIVNYLALKLILLIMITLLITLSLAFDILYLFRKCWLYCSLHVFLFFNQFCLHWILIWLSILKNWFVPKYYILKSTKKNEHLWPVWMS